MSSCFSRCLRDPIAMRRFYGQTLWILHKFLVREPGLAPRAVRLLLEAALSYAVVSAEPRTIPLLPRQQKSSRLLLSAVPELPVQYPRSLVRAGRFRLPPSQPQTWFARSVGLTRSC